MSGGGRFRFVEGATSDLAFAASGEALLAATVERPQAVEPKHARTLRLRDGDRELLLLRFLNELIYLRDAEGLVLRPTRIDLREDGAFELVAELAGETLDPARHGLACDVKAATAHALALRRAGEAWQASVTLDV
jgi:SHS2 domain-containing protein